MAGQDMLQMQVTLAKAMDDTSILRSRLRAELEHRQVLENKIADLTEKLSDAKRGLQETKSALNKVQTVASQLIAKRDEREVQLQQALDQNGVYERKIAELEMHISHVSQLAEAQNNSAVSEKLLQGYKERERLLEDELATMRTQWQQAKREVVRLADEKADVEYALESKKKRIAVLEEHAAKVSAESTNILTPDLIASTRDSILMSMLDMTRAQTAGATVSPMRHGSMMMPLSNVTPFGGAAATAGGEGAVNVPAVAMETNPIALALANAVAAVNAAPAAAVQAPVTAATSTPAPAPVKKPTTPPTEIAHMETKINSLESDKKGLEDRLIQLERQLVDQQKNALAQQQRQIEVQKQHQQLQLQQMAQQQQQIAILTRNSILADGINAAATTPRSAMGSRQRGNGGSMINANGLPPSRESGMQVQASLGSSGSSSGMPIAFQPQQQLSVQPQVQIQQHQPFQQPYQQQQPQQQQQPTYVSSSSAAVPQPVLAEAEAQQVLREILSSRDQKARPRTRERDRSSSSNNNNVNSSDASRQQSPEGGAGRNRSRANTRESMTRNVSNGNGYGNDVTLPIQTQTVNFQNTASNHSANHANNSNDFATALQQTQRAFENNTLGNGAFVAAVRDDTDNSLESSERLGSMKRVGSVAGGTTTVPDGEDPEEYKRKLNDEKKAIKKSIVDWMKKFQQENNREPNKAERELYAGSMYRKYRQVTDKLNVVVMIIEYVLMTMSVVLWLHWHCYVMSFDNFVFVFMASLTVVCTIVSCTEIEDAQGSRRRRGHTECTVFDADNGRHWRRLNQRKVKAQRSIEKLCTHGYENV